MVQFDPIPHHQDHDPHSRLVKGGKRGGKAVKTLGAP